MEDDESKMPGWKSMNMFQRNPHFLKKIEHNIMHLQELLKPEDELLDVGCCQGHLYHYLKHPKYTGIDLFPENIAEARNLHPAGKFEVMDLFDLKGSWDVVFCSRVLIHVPNFHKAVAILRAAARKHCIITLPISSDTCELEKDGPYFRTFSKQTVMGSGALEIKTSRPYSTVIYGPLLP
jgi:2-polyprenyl-3-methyl-5-hydroxy-6-metoxy-1,4-benzoquinol methylase